MRLIIIGCEYAGKTTLAVGISKWMIQSMGLPYVRWHNHFVLPKLDQHLIVHGKAEPDGELPGKTAVDLFGEAEEKEILSLSPLLLEQVQRHMIWRHLYPSMYGGESDYLLINWYYADAVYAPLYYGYGEAGSFADRSHRARAWDAELLRMAPDTVLVLVTASAEAIRERMREQPRSNCILRPQDVDTVLSRFREECNDSLIYRRITVDTTSASQRDTLETFLHLMRPHLSQFDLLRVATHSGLDTFKLGDVAGGGGRS